MQTPFNHFPEFLSIQGKRRSWNSLCPVGLDPAYPSGLLGFRGQGAQNTTDVGRPTNPVFTRRRRYKSIQPALRHWIDGTCKSQSREVFRESVAEVSEDIDLKIVSDEPRSRSQQRSIGPPTLTKAQGPNLACFSRKLLAERNSGRSDSTFLHIVS